jgi:hypothetical protein
MHLTEISHAAAQRRKEKVWLPVKKLPLRRCAAA